MYDVTELRRTVNDWQALTQKQQLFEQTGEEWIFRGHSNETWNLQTSLERASDEFITDPVSRPKVEVQLILEFIRHYHLYTNDSPPRAGDTLDWLALMRHHGAPTRLLDFSFSFLIASYFALADKPAGNPVVWAVNKSWLTRVMKDWGSAPGRVDDFEKLARYRDGDAFRKLFLGDHPKIVFPISPFRRNERLAIQRGVFLCPGSVEEPMMDIFKSLTNYDENVFPVAIAVDQRNHLLRSLSDAGINHAALFPGLDGFAQSLRTKLLLFEYLLTLEKSGARSPINIDLDLLKSW